MFPPSGGEGVQLPGLYHGGMSAQLHRESGNVLHCVMITSTFLNQYIKLSVGSGPDRHWLHRLQRGSDLSRVPPLHKVWRLQRVPAGHHVRGSSHPGLWQVHPDAHISIGTYCVCYLSVWVNSCNGNYCFADNWLTPMSFYFFIATRCFLSLVLEPRSLQTGRSLDCWHQILMIWWDY